MAGSENNRRVGMVPWVRDPDDTVASPAPCGDRAEAEERRESNVCAELEFMKPPELVRQDSESTRAEPRRSRSCRLVCWKDEVGSELAYGRSVLAGSIVLIILLLTVCVSLLSLHLQVNVKLSRYQEERDELSFNRSILMEVLEEQALSLLLRANLSSLLLHHQAKNLQEINMLEQKDQEVQENYTILRKEFETLVENHLLVPRESVLLQNCQPRESGAAGWQLYEKSCYLLSPHALSWQESLQWCRRQGGHLAVINNEDTQYFMQGFVKRTSWIGLSDRDIEGDWRWVDGTPYDTTTRFWILKQPNNTDSEDCVTVTPGSGWSDEICFKLYSSVCERRAHQLQWNGHVLSN